MNLIDFEKVDTLLEGFNQSTGFVTAILDLDGNVLSKSGWRQVCTEFHRINPGTSKKCTISDTILAGQLAADKKYHFYKCLNGLIDVAVPIVIKGEHIANLFSGQFFFEEPNEHFFKEQAKKYGFDEERYLEALRKVPVISEVKVKVAMEFLQNMTQIISEMAFQKLEQTALNEELRTSEERYRLVLENSMDAILLMTTDGVILSANQAARTIFQRSEEDLCRIGRAGIVDKSDPLLPILIEERKRTGKAKGELLMLRNDGSKFPVELSSSLYSDQSGQQRISIIIRDITERKLAEEALRENEERYRLISDVVSDYIFTTKIGENGKLELSWVTGAFERITGYSFDEYIAHGGWRAALHPDDIEKDNQDIEELKKNNKLVTDVRTLAKDGRIIWVRVYAHPVWDYQNNELVGIYGGVKDITESKLAEEALIQASSELEQLQNNLDEAVFSVDTIHNKMLYVSKAHQTVFGQAPIEFFNNPQLWYDIILREDKHIVDAGYPVLYSGKNLQHQYRIAHPNGEIHWVEAKMNPTLDENGQLTRVDGIAYDVTTRKMIETKLLESEINFRRSISDSPVGIRIVSEDEDTVYANKAFLDMYEFNSLEEFTGTPAKVLYTPESYIFHQERKKKRNDGVDVSNYEISINCKNGDIRHVKVSRKEILWNGKQHFQVINQDITEQRKAEEELRKLSTAVEQSPNAECITDPEGIIEYINPTTSELTGYTPEELLGQRTNIFSSGEKPKEEYDELWKTIKLGNVWKGELHNKKKNGELYWESTTISPIFDNTGKITHFLAIKVDISERKRVETALLNSEEQLRKFASHLQNIREEEKIAIAREIHDDLGQLLVALQIDAGLLKNKVIKIIPLEDTEIQSKFDNLVALIKKSIKTARNIMNDLRPALLEMHGLVGATKEYLREFEERNRISCEFEDQIHDVKMTPQQSLVLFRILQEAMNNIVKHAKATLVRVQLQSSDNKIILQITDNGVGFDENNSGREDSYGMIGMKERIILLEGTLDITSKVGHGTTVQVEIPNIAKKV